jgi:hypothetical protein
MRKIEKRIIQIKSPIERIFYDIVKREMTAYERRILLPPADKTRKRN